MSFGLRPFHLRLSGLHPDRSCSG